MEYGASLTEVPELHDSVLEHANPGSCRGLGTLYGPSQPGYIVDNAQKVG